MNASDISKAISAMDRAVAYLYANRTYTNLGEGDLIMDLRISSVALKLELEKIEVKIKEFA